MIGRPPITCFLSEAARLTIDDSFPYEALDASSEYWSFYLHGETKPVGSLLRWVVDKMPWDLEVWELDHEKKSVVLKGQNPQSHSKIIADTVGKAKELGLFEVLKGWRQELYPIYGHSSQNKHPISIERSASPLFGINTYGAHLTAYINTPEGIKIWVPRRSRNKQTYGGMLDNTVAGGLAINEEPFNCLVREAAEEASLPEDLIRSKAKSCGTVSYYYVRSELAGGETGLLQPECQYVYDIELPTNVEPRPNDEEVECFYLWSLDKVKEALANGEFKPNCALVILDFFVRHGLLTPENEPDYNEIIFGLHRRLPFPTP